MNVSLFSAPSARLLALENKVDTKLDIECVHFAAGPRIAVEDNSRMPLRIRAEEKALLLRAVALKHTDLTDFVIRNAVEAARAVVEEADRLQLSERDSLRVLDLLENPPVQNAKLLAAARALPKRRRSRDGLARRADRQEAQSASVRLWRGSAQRLLAALRPQEPRTGRCEDISCD